MVIETKYNVGEDVFFMRDNRILHGNITAILIKVASIPDSTKKVEYEICTYGTGIKTVFYSENSLYTTKQELLSSL